MTRVYHGIVMEELYRGRNPVTHRLEWRRPYDANLGGDIYYLAGRGLKRKPARKTCTYAEWTAWVLPAP